MIIAFGAGILSFLSPCVLPLVPGYLSMVSGLSAAELAAVSVSTPTATAGPTTPATLATPATPATSSLDPSAQITSSVGSSAVAVAVDAPSDVDTVVAANRRALFIGIGLFICGFTIIFVALGAAASGIGHVLHEHVGFLTDLSGVIVIVLGVVLLFSAAPAEFYTRLGSGPGGFIARLTGERRFAVRPSQLGLWAAPVMGMAFAFAWTPCVGPVLGPILGLAANNGKLVGGVVLLFAYSLGLGLPFVATGLAFERLTAAFARARRTLGIIQLIAALILIVFGILLITGNEAWVSTQFNNLLDHLGLSRLAKS